jgi:3'-5' exoribonuclease
MIYKKQKSISEYKPNDSFQDVFIVRFTKEIRSTKNGKYFFEIKIQDSLGDGMLKYWGSENKANVEQIYNSIQPDTVILAEGTVSEFNGNLDFSVNEGRIKVLTSDEYNISDFIRKSEKDPEEMYSKLKEFIELVEDTEYKQVLTSFFNDEEFVKKFKTSPGAMYIHHGWASGLLEHTLSVTQICIDLTKFHKLDKDLLITGAILHDIGKIEEFVTTTQIKITDKGNLLSHMILGVQELTRRLDKIQIDEIKKTKLIHTMISHHGAVEFGCPKPPMFPEALIIAKADELDANVVTMTDAKANAQTNDSFIYNKQLGNIYLD